MKKFILLTALFAGAIFFHSNAQVKVNVNLNVGSQPVWGPTGYDRADYYYLPDIDCYYDINRSQFIYNSGNRWVFASQLPSRYRNYDLYNSYKVVVNEPKPYLHADIYRNKYRNNNRSAHEKQVPIRDSRDEKYYQVKGHPMHDQWVKNHPDDHQNGHDHGRH